MSEDWAAVAKAINGRVLELGWRQRDLVERSNVSQAIVREIQHHAVERRRSARTLEALSVALGWHPQHLDAVLHGRRPPEVDELVSDEVDTMWTRLSSIDGKLGEIADLLREMNANLANLADRPDDGRRTR